MLEQFNQQIKYVPETTHPQNIVPVADTSKTPISAI